MRNLLRFVTVPAALVLLAGCGDPLLFARVDDRSVAVTQGLPSAPGLPAVEVPSVTLASVDFQVGDINLGLDTRGSRLTLNRVVLAMVSAAPGTTFAGITHASVTIAPPAGTPGLGPQEVASYDQARDGVAGTSLVLTPSGDFDLLPYVFEKTIAVSISASGTPPGPLGSTWTSDLTLDFHVVAQASL